MRIKGNMVDIGLDLPKASDKASHQRLLSKPSDHGIRGQILMNCVVKGQEAWLVRNKQTILSDGET